MVWRRGVEDLLPVSPLGLLPVRLSLECRQKFLAWMLHSYLMMEWIKEIFLKTIKI